jgi:two-component system, cell cycle response regulator DivK
LYADSGDRPEFQEAAGHALRAESRRVWARAAAAPGRTLAHKRAAVAQVCHAIRATTARYCQESLADLLLEMAAFNPHRSFDSSEGQTVHAITRSGPTPDPADGTGLPDVLLGRRLVSRDDLSTAARHAEREESELAESLVALGFVAESAAFEALASAAGAPFIAIDGVIPSELAVRLVPEKLARQYGVVPLNVDHGTLTYATSRPFNAAADRDLASASGRRTQLVIAARTSILAALDRTYTNVGRRGAPRRLRIERPIDLDRDSTFEADPRPGTPAAAPRATSAATRDRTRVLVVDDEPITRLLVKALLVRHRYEVFQAGNGREGIEVARRERPDVTLIDLNMPEMDGYAAIRRMRTDERLATMSIIVLTGEEGPGVERRVLEVGADDYVIKPFDPTVLLSRVNAVFRRLRMMAA